MFELFFGLIDFLKLVLPLTVFFFIIQFFFEPIRKKIVDKYDLSWVKSCLVLNFVTIFLIIFIFYLYFFLIGGIIAPTTDSELAYNFFEYFLMIALASIRILIASIILSIGLLFFEVFSSVVIELQKEKEYSDAIKRFIGIFCSTSLFLLLLFFVFNWVPLGLFVYIFYGVVGDLPLLTIINIIRV